MKKISLKQVLIVACVMVGCAGLGFGTTMLVKSIAKKSRNKEVQVAFFGLPDSVKNSLENWIKENSKSKTSFYSIDAEYYDAKKVAQKYDLLFSWDGQVLSEQEAKAEKISKKCYVQQPLSFNNTDGKQLKVCVDHFEIAYNIAKIKESGVEYPSSFAELDRFLSDMSGYVFCPFLFEGGNDEVLLAFLSCYIEGKAGSDGYKAFLAQAAKNPDYNALSTYAIPAANGQDFTLVDVISELKLWPEKGYTHPSWYRATDVDVNIFTETDQVAVMFTSLSRHRNLSYNNVSKYEACRFPIARDGVNHGLIAPSVACVKFRNSNVVNDLLASMVSPEAQEIISNNTMLGPASLQGQAYDRQADDVRFWAAACKDGPLPDLYNAIFQLDAEAGAQFANAVRDYLRS